MYSEFSTWAQLVRYRFDCVIYHATKRMRVRFLMTSPLNRSTVDNPPSDGGLAGFFSLEIVMLVPLPLAILASTALASFSLP